MLYVRFSVTDTGLKGFSRALGANYGSRIRLSNSPAAKGSHSLLTNMKLLTHVNLTALVILIPNELYIIKSDWVARQPSQSERKALFLRQLAENDALSQLGELL